MEITFGGNSFFTSKKDAMTYARVLATATVYHFRGVVVNGEVRLPDRFSYERVKMIYLVMGLGEGCSEKSADIVQYAMGEEVVASREDFKWV